MLLECFYLRVEVLTLCIKFALQVLHLLGCCVLQSGESFFRFLEVFF